jgi:transcription elongation factor Elf1
MALEKIGPLVKKFIESFHLVSCPNCGDSLGWAVNGTKVECAHCGKEELCITTLLKRN